ncbi:hypothetical protein [Labrenzia sp. OB1]|uniref:hypothetical protein n=1 Tax=Labrenzia sp. OB1 TaxID=1561204 RepID=UPI000AE23F0D|nr:hypothetical protein [Labrenzia sp. OB1]
MRSGYTLVTTLGLMILISGLVVGLNTLVSGSIRNSAASRANLSADLALDSSLELGQAIILGNITLSATDKARVPFDGAPIACTLGAEFASILKIQDVAGLVDLRFSSDELLTVLLREFTPQDATHSLLTRIRENANSGRFLSAEDVLLTSGIQPDSAEWIGAYSTVHGRDHRLARDVTPKELVALMASAGQDNAGNFGASPSNATFKLETFSKSQSGRDAYSSSLYSFDYSNGLAFTRLFEKRWLRRSSPGKDLSAMLASADTLGLRCSQLSLN